MKTIDEWGDCASVRENDLMAGGHLPSLAMLADELTDAEATRRVFLTAGGLLVLGLALLIGTVWWWRTTRPEHPCLAPLEVMSDRRWSKADAEQRRQMIATSHIAGAAVPAAQAPPSGHDADRVDLSELVGSVPSPLGDLAELDVLLGLVRAGPGGANGDDAVGVSADVDAAGAHEVVDHTPDDDWGGAHEADAAPAAVALGVSLEVADAPDADLGREIDALSEQVRDAPVDIDEHGAVFEIIEGDEQHLELIDPHPPGDEVTPQPEADNTAIDPLLQRTSVKD